MRQVLYNSAGYRLRFEYPPSWAAATVTSTKITVTDLSATELLAATACTQFTANTLSAATSAGDNSLVLSNAVAYSPVEGDLFEIAASSNGPSEVVECLYYTSATKTMTLREDMRYAHAASSAINGRFCYYDIVTTVIATFTKSLQMVLSWQPYASTALAYPAAIERAEIAAYVFDSGDIESSVRLRYPREYQVITANGVNRFADYYNDAKRELRARLKNKVLFMDRVVDQEALTPTFVALIRYMVTLTGGDDWTAEQIVALAEYTRQFNELITSPIWEDYNQDLNRGSSTTTSTTGDTDEISWQKNWPLGSMRGF
jgi:hypothetical protein